MHAPSPPAPRQTRLGSASAATPRTGGAGRQAAARLAVALLSGLLAACQGAAGGAPAPELQALQQNCVNAMLRSSCRAMSGPEAAPTASVIFVAGVGAVDARAYGELRAAGEAMCGIAHRQCSADWEAPACRTARSLWLAGSVATATRADPGGNQTR